MEKTVRIITGNFELKELRIYIIALVAGFWGLILMSWISFPADHHYSIMTHTFSFLGSFEAKHNPEWWWIFSIAMLSGWGLGFIPLILFLYRRFALISGWAAAVGAFFYLLGCCGVIGVALFPDAHGVVIAGLEWTEIHEKVAILVAIGFALGNLWHAGILLWDRFLTGGDYHPGIFHGRMIWPYLFWGLITGTGVFYLLRWEKLYAAMKAEAALTGAHIGSSWSEAMNTRYSFPLWENIGIYTLHIFFIWFVLAMSMEKEA